MTEGGLSADLHRAIRVKPETARLVEIRRFVEEVAVGVGLDAEKIFDLKVAVSEACANAVEHAGSKTPLLEVSAFRSAGRLTFTVTDNGAFRTPTPGRREDDNRGLGIPLMVALVDDVTFSRVPGGGTTVSLSVIFAPGEA